MRLKLYWTSGLARLPEITRSLETTYFGIDLDLQRPTSLVLLVHAGGEMLYGKRIRLACIV